MDKCIGKLTVEVDTTALDAAMEKAMRLIELLDEIEKRQSELAQFKMPKPIKLARLPRGGGFGNR